MVLGTYYFYDLISKFLILAMLPMNLQFSFHLILTEKKKIVKFLTKNTREEHNTIFEWIIEG